jgi:hypothetical protein
MAPVLSSAAGSVPTLDSGADRRQRIGILALAVGWLLVWYGPLLSPGTLLLNRDVLVLHLPLRTAWRRLAETGFAGWNPWLHGGEPVWSNPSYGTWYPPNWLSLAVAPAFALNLLVVFHAAVAFAGVWVLLRRAGAGRAATLFGAIGWSGAGGFVAGLDALVLLFGAAWIPWVVAAAQATVEAPEDRWKRSASLAGALLALPILNGEPVTALLTVVALLALAFPSGPGARQRAPRLAVVLGLGLGLAAVQWIPALDRAQESVRGEGLSSAAANTWSLHPARLVELVHPRLLGDVTRAADGHYLGSALVDRGYPLFASIYPGLAVVLLAVGGLARGAPRRLGWCLLLAVALFVAAGRHNPLFPLVRELLPGVSGVRYPEKFALLLAFTLPVVAALGWHRVLADRDAAGERLQLPHLLAGLALLTAVAVAVFATAAPTWMAGLVRTYGTPGLAESAIASVVASYRRDAWGVVVVTALTWGLLVAAGRPQTSRRTLGLAAVALVGFDLWWFGHRLVVRGPASLLAEAPAPFRDLGVPRDRLVLLGGAREEVLLFARTGNAGFDLARAQRNGLVPYAPLVWGITTALDPDFELMATPWGRHARTLLDQLVGGSPEVLGRYLGAWNVGVVALPKPAEQLARDLAADRDASGVVVFPNRFVLPRVRTVAEARCHPDPVAASAAAVAEGFLVERREHLVCPTEMTGATFASVARVVSFSEAPGQVAVELEAPAGGFLVAAITFDRGWTANVDGQRSVPLPTAAGQIAIRLPPGADRVELRYRDPMLRRGLVVSAVALLLLLGLALRGGAPATYSRQ